MALSDTTARGDGCALITWGGEDLVLWPQKALSWPRTGTLIVADAHFGKDAHFRVSGIPVPAGTSPHDLERIDALIRASGSSRLVILGDFLHDVGSRAEETFAALRAWRERNPALAILLVGGNHDRRAGPPPEQLGIEVVSEPFDDGPFALLHHPREIVGRFALAGHVHPGVRLAPTGGARGRFLNVPIFLFRERLAILPAFGGFTGLGFIEPEPHERVFLCGARSIVEWSPP